MVGSDRFWSRLVAHGAVCGGATLEAVAAQTPDGAVLRAEFRNRSEGPVPAAWWSVASEPNSVLVLLRTRSGRTVLPSPARGLPARRPRCP